MTATDPWLDRNETYLGTALTWLRLRLEQHARRVQSAPAPGVADVPPSSATIQPSAEPTRWNVFRRSATAAATADPDDDGPRLLLPAGDAAMAAARLQEASEVLATASEGEPPPALLLLSRRLGLSAFERDILLLCLGVELDTRVAALCAQAQDDPGRPFPTFALAMSLFDDPAWDALSPERPLRYWRLVEITQPGTQALMTSALRVDERILSYVKGLNYIDDRLAPLLSPLPHVDADTLPASQRATVASIVAMMTGAERPVGPIVLLGRDRVSKREVTGAVSAVLDVHFSRLAPELLPAHPGELETTARLWQRESVLLPVALYVDAHDIDKAGGADGVHGRLSRFLLRAAGLVVVDTRDSAAAAFEGAFPVDVGKPAPAEQRAIWTTMLTDRAGSLPERLAGQFNLSQHEIRDIAARVGDVDAMDDPMADRLWRQCLAQTRPHLDRLAVRIETKATWDDLVLPEAEARTLRQIAAQVQARSRVYDDWGFRARMNRGLGITALFAGDSGTGKTMAAEVLANALQLDLYRIDLSAVISKYIGETEKNLRQVFDAAEDGGAILFFDEADAIFGKRSEVKDSHDRYANIEVNYLLQRMEAYHGLAILATNMKSALDAAFMRRLRFVVTFPFPGVVERTRIWQQVFPAATRIDGIDHQRLARFNLTGGSIHNIALNAAFLAAGADSPVTMPLVLEAARDELRKLERPVNEADFRWLEPVGGRA